MKVKHFARIVLIIVGVGGLIAYIIYRKKNYKSKQMDSRETGEFPTGNEHVTNEKKCDETIYQINENMNARTEQARQVLYEIHDDMKKSAENIASQKEDIEEMLEKLKR